MHIERRLWIKRLTGYRDKAIQVDFLLDAVEGGQLYVGPALGRHTEVQVVQPIQRIFQSPQRKSSYQLNLLPRKMLWLSTSLIIFLSNKPFLLLIKSNGSKVYTLDQFLTANFRIIFYLIHFSFYVES